MGILYVRPALRQWADPGLALGGGGAALPFSDDFARADGALGNGWTGATWTIVSNKAVNTPTAGSELLSNPGFEGTYDTEAVGIDIAPGWNNRLLDTGTDTASKEETIIHGGVAAQKFVADAALEGVVSEDVALTIGNWYRMSIWARGGAGNEQVRLLNFTGALVVITVNTTLSTSYQRIVRTAHAGATGNENLRFVNNATATNTIYADDASFVALALADLFATRDFGAADVDVSAAVTLELGAPAGVVINSDSAATPANFVVAYHDGTSVKLDKCVGGVYTNLISTIVAYSAGAVVRVTKSGNAYRLYYGGVQRGTDQTVSDAGIISNTRHGMFSTDAGSSLDDFEIFFS